MYCRQILCEFGRLIVSLINFIYLTLFLAENINIDEQNYTSRFTISNMARELNRRYIIFFFWQSKVHKLWNKQINKKNWTQGRRSNCRRLTQKYKFQGFKGRFCLSGQSENLSASTWIISLRFLNGFTGLGIRAWNTSDLGKVDQSRIVHHRQWPQSPPQYSASTLSDLKAGGGSFLGPKP